MQVKFTGQLPLAQQLAAEEVAITLSEDLSAVENAFGTVGTIGIALEQMLDLVRVLTEFARAPDQAAAMQIRDSYVEQMVDLVVLLEGQLMDANLRRAILRAQAIKSKAYRTIENSEHETIAEDVIRRARS